MKYRTIIADPPWPMKTGPMSGGGMAEGFLGGDGLSRPVSYETMTFPEIAAMPIREWAEADAHLYLWVPNKHLESAFSIARAWGFRYSTTLVWKKKLMGGGLGGAFGISSEYILFCRRGSLRAKTKIKGTVFEWKRPYDARGKPRHSAKPPEFVSDVVEVVSPAPFLDLFSRVEKPRIGWHYWGDESLATADLPAAVVL